ncbi:MAG: radical SAM-associated putative lipoprotein [Bacteroidetes bacterium]|nr:radical SAM-associated putative lipoprotein [Bacteroidota bacterium]
MNTKSFWRKTFYFTWNKLLIALLGILGFATSCGEKMYGTPVPVYGVPVVKFVLNGTVKSKPTDQPIRNIRVIMYNDTAFSDSLGGFQVTTQLATGERQFPLSLKDIDSTLNGSYQDLETTVTFYTGIHEGSGGTYTKDTLIYLVPKK